MTEENSRTLGAPLRYTFDLHSREDKQNRLGGAGGGESKSLSLLSPRTGSVYSAVALAEL